MRLKIGSSNLGAVMGMRARYGVVFLLQNLREHRRECSGKSAPGFEFDASLLNSGIVVIDHNSTISPLCFDRRETQLTGFE